MTGRSAAAAKRDSSAMSESMITAANASEKRRYAAQVEKDMWEQMLATLKSVSGGSSAPLDDKVAGQKAAKEAMTELGSLLADGLITPNEYKDELRKRARAFFNDFVYDVIRD